MCQGRQAILRSVYLLAHQEALQQSFWAKPSRSQPGGGPLFTGYKITQRYHKFHHMLYN